jgi:23S rRNA (cytosine1962-C5)-methyltransferase
MSDYALLDCGEETKLERFGDFLLERPAPAALWRRRWAPDRWQEAHAVYHRSEGGGGSWEERHPLPEEWEIELGGMRLRVQPTGFGHLGVFPEQLPFWDWMRRRCTAAGRPLQVLNLFAYTGGASIACARGGAVVTHCDASRGIVGWASENARRNGLDQPRPDGAQIRWIIDDAHKFVSREHRRGNRYEGILLDPPSFGRGPKGQVFKLERDLADFLDQVAGLLAPDASFLLLSAHTPGVGPLTLRNLLAGALGARAGTLDCGEMTIAEAGDGRVLPSGTWSAWSADGVLPRDPEQAR